MKTLYIVRHAKSSKDWTSIPDIDRPLNERGYSDAHLIGEKLFLKKIKVDLLVSSPAIRAYTTGLIIARSIQYPEDKIVLNKRLYETTVSEHLSVISETNDKFESLMIFGHNPTFSETCFRLLNKPADEMPTCAVAGISFNINSWEELPDKTGELSLYIYPKLFA